MTVFESHFVNKMALGDPTSILVLVGLYFVITTVVLIIRS